MHAYKHIHALPTWWETSKQASTYYNYDRKESSISITHLEQLRWILEKREIKLAKIKCKYIQDPKLKTCIQHVTMFIILFLIMHIGNNPNILQKKDDIATYWIVIQHWEWNTVPTGSIWMNEWMSEWYK